MSIFISCIKFHLGGIRIQNRALTQNNDAAFATIDQMIRDLAVIKEKMNLIENRLESITVSVVKIESICGY